MTTKMYNADGDEIIVQNDAVERKLTQGWTLEPPRPPEIMHGEEVPESPDDVEE